MPCTVETSRKDDKFTAWKNAYDEFQGAGNLALAADAAGIATCGVAIWTLGGGGFTAAACAAALAALAVALANFETSLDKSRNAGDAYHVAAARLDECLAKLRP